MGFVTLTSDLGQKDPSVSLVKIDLLKDFSSLNIVDISHAISPFNKLEAYFILKTAYKFFPENTIHLVGVDDACKINEPHLVVEVNNHFFVGADNGILSLLLKNENISKIIELSNKVFNTNSSFPLKDVFVPVAKHILRGGKIELLGKKKTSLNDLLTTTVKIKDNSNLIGEVIYIDNYGNAVTNIEKVLYDSIKNNRRFEILFKNYTVTKIYENYYELVTKKEKEESFHGDLGIIFNSNSLLEIFIYKSNPQNVGSANQLLGLSIGSKVYINFFN